MKNIAKIVEFENHDVVCVREGSSMINFTLAVKTHDAIVNPTIGKDYHVKFVVDHLFGEQNEEMTIVGDGAEALREEAEKMLNLALQKVSEMKA